MKCPRCSKDIPDDSQFCCYCARVIVRKTPARMHQRGNGTGTAIKVGKTWKAIVTLGWSVDKDMKLHQHRHTKSGFKTKNEALAYCVQYHTSEHKKPAPPLKDYWEIYARGKLEKLSDSKRTAYNIAWAKLSQLHFRKVDTITVGELCRIVSEKASTYYPARDMKTVLTHLFALAAADGHARRDLPSYIELPPLNEKKREPFTPDEQTALWHAYETGCTDAAIPLIMIYTGMMPGELRRLDVSMIDYESQQINGVGMKTKVRKESPVYLADAIIPILQDITQGATGLVFPISEDQFYQRYYAALEAADVRRLTPYSCRHTTATALAITEHIAPQTVQKIMRWSSTKMLDRYAHPDQDDALVAVNTIS